MPKACKKDVVLEHARRLILAEGYASASVRRIAKEAGLTTGAIYSNFRNKAEILGILLIEAWTLIKEITEETVAQAGDEIDAFTYLEAYSEFARRHPEYFNIWIYVSTREELLLELHEEQRATLAERSRAMYQHVLDFIVESQAERGLVKAEPALILASCIVLSSGLFQQRKRFLYKHLGIKAQDVQEFLYCCLKRCLYPEAAADLPPCEERRNSSRSE